MSIKNTQPLLLLVVLSPLPQQQKDLRFPVGIKFFFKFQSMKKARKKVTLSTWNSTTYKQYKDILSTNFYWSRPEHFLGNIWILTN